MCLSNLCNLKRMFKSYWWWWLLIGEWDEEGEVGIDGYLDKYCTMWSVQMSWKERLNL